jgi:hypothetical protein
MVSLFGWLDACIALDDVRAPNGMIPGEMQILEIPLPERKLSKYSLYEYIQLRAARENASGSS